ncbi:hypothetical protein ABIE41_000415 [Bosea sp. OAE506]|uniref:hypothetical protein n=1 Tax=Bosea sp. OAE506 TaxID=2663870 RepID=UPI00178AB6BE
MVKRNQPKNTADHVVNEIRDRLEQLGAVGRPFAIFDPDLMDSAGWAELPALGRSQPVGAILAVAVPAAVVPDLLPFLHHDHRQAFMQGRPIVINPIEVEMRDENRAHRPHDTERLKSAKTALAAHTFRIVSAQTAIELARSAEKNRAAAADAGKRARERVENAVWRGGNDPDGTGKMRRFDGLIDRGRRLALTFFGVERANDVTKAEEGRIADRIGPFNDDPTALEETAATLEREHVDQVRDLADHELRAQAHEGAMARWSASVRAGRPVEFADGLDVTNGTVTRQSAPTLMRLAIDGNLNPIEVNRNMETMREACEVGRLIGLLRKGQAIALTRGQAAILIQSLQVFISQLHGSGRPETEADGCDWYLADAALNCHDLSFWNRTIARILETGATETIEPMIP